jgi:hypothetical protein
MNLLNAALKIPLALKNFYRHSISIIHKSLCLALDRLTIRQRPKLANFIAHHEVLKIVNEFIDVTYSDDL